MESWKRSESHGDGTHNALGQITDIGADDFDFDDAGNLIEAPASTGMSYAPDGSLYERRAGSTATRYQQSGASVTAEWDGSWYMARRYVHAGGLGAPLMRYEGSNTSDRNWYFTDERGSVIAEADDSGASLYTNTYDEYGVEGSANTGRFGYAGQLRLPGTGLTHNRNRVYNAGLGRFMTTDPIGQAGGLNLYGYVGGDPVNRVDPLGLAPDGEVPRDTVTVICPTMGPYFCPFFYQGRNWPGDGLPVNWQHPHISTGRVPRPESPASCLETATTTTSFGEDGGGFWQIYLSRSGVPGVGGNRVPHTVEVTASWPTTETSVFEAGQLNVEFMSNFYARGMDDPRGTFSYPTWTSELDPNDGIASISLKFEREQIDLMRGSIIHIASPSSGRVWGHLPAGNAVAMTAIFNGNCDNEGN